MTTIPPEDDVIDDEELDNKIRSLLSKHKLMKKREHVDKECSSSNTLLSKYDTTRVLALRARAKLTEEREMNKQINIAVTNNEEGDEAEFLERVAGVDFSENVIASPQRGSIRPKSASSGRRKKQYMSKTTPFLNRYETAAHPTTPKSDKKKKNTYQSDLDFYDPPQLPSPLQEEAHSPTIGQRQKPKAKPTIATFNPDDWWNEQQRNNPDAPYKMPIRRSKSDPVLKRPKSAGRVRTKAKGSDNAMSTKDLKTYLTESRQSKTRPPSSRMYLADYKKAQEQKKEAIMSAILEEANNRETKVHVCLDEANSYAKYLGLSKRYSVYWRSGEMNNQSTAIRKPNSKPLNTYEMAMAMNKTDSSHAFNTLQGTGSRIEKMMIEVMEARGDVTKLMNVDNFLREHESLQIEVRRKRNLMSTEHRVQEDREEKIKAKDVGGKRKGVVDKQESFLIHLEKMKAKEEANNNSKSSMKIRRKETEEKVNKILESTANVTKILENQLRELQSRGWNETT
mmetsp:Transcript_17359/g.29054  ORF Transcript_17359/g.29054 Transcript_17359/m.29054 type:complete len:510 (+) Transcript_17359:116-1645(+)